MTYPAKGILINPTFQTISPVELASWRDISRLAACEFFDSIRVDEVNFLYLDDEGLLHAPKPLFEIAGYSQPLAGNALILGADEIGETIDCSLSVEEVTRLVSWRPDLELSHFEQSESRVGEIFVLKNQAKFRAKDSSEKN